ATQDQVALSVLTSVFAVWTAACGALVVLIWGSIGAFYVSELLNAVLTTAVVRVYARRRIGRFGGTSTFRGEYLKALVRESVGLIWTNGIGGLITQLDRLFISRLLPATSLGTYVAATAGGRLLSMVYAPFFQASYPQLCELVATEGGAEKAGPVVIRNARIVAIACLSVGVPLAVFAEDFLAVWTRSAVVATQGGLAMGIYIGGSILIAFASVLYQAQVAMRIIRPSVVFNTAAIVWFPLTLWFLVSGWGIAGAACAWLCYGLATWLVSVVVTGGLVGRPGWWRGYLVGLLPVVVLAAGLTALARVVADTFTQQPLIRIALAVLGGALILMSAVLVTFGGALPREIKAIWRRRPSTAGDPGPSRPDAPRSEA
ncbi:MAG TPA: oligosaccharide flippase family protein, partial [Polyangia bacterium]